MSGIITEAEESCRKQAQVTIETGRYDFAEQWLEAHGLDTDEYLDFVAATAAKTLKSMKQENSVSGLIHGIRYTMQVGFEVAAIKYCGFLPGAGPASSAGLIHQLELMIKRAREDEQAARERGSWHAAAYAEGCHNAASQALALVREACHA